MYIPRDTNWVPKAANGEAKSGTQNAPSPDSKQTLVSARDVSAREATNSGANIIELSAIYEEGSPLQQDKSKPLHYNRLRYRPEKKPTFSETVWSRQEIGLIESRSVPRAVGTLSSILSTAGKTFHLILRHPAITVSLAAFVVWLVLGEQAAVKEEQYKQRIAVLESEVKAVRRIGGALGLSTTQQDTSAQRSSELLDQAVSEELPIVQTTIELDGTEKDDPVAGPPEANTLVMLFIDLECERCGKFYLESIAPLVERARTKRDLRFILRDLPLPTNKFAISAANLAQCAGVQGAYFSTLEALFASSGKLTASGLKSIAANLAVRDKGKLLRCVQSERFRNEILADRDYSLKAGATGVPSLFIGRLSNRNSYTGELIRGAQPPSVISEAIKRMANRPQTG